MPVVNKPRVRVKAGKGPKSDDEGYFVDSRVRYALDWYEWAMLVVMLIGLGLMAQGLWSLISKACHG